MNWNSDSDCESDSILMDCTFHITQHENEAFPHTNNLISKHFQYLWYTCYCAAIFIFFFPSSTSSPSLSMPFSRARRDTLAPMRMSCKVKITNGIHIITPVILVYQHFIVVQNEFCFALRFVSYQFHFCCVSLILSLFFSLWIFSHSSNSLSHIAKYLFYFLAFCRPYTHTSRFNWAPSASSTLNRIDSLWPFLPITTETHTHTYSTDFDYYLLRFGFDLWQFTITKVVTYNNIFARKLSLLLLLLLLVLLLHVYLGSFSGMDEVRRHRWWSMVLFLLLFAADSLWIVGFVFCHFHGFILFYSILVFSLSHCFCSRCRC